jgi:hypothetical protein
MGEESGGGWGKGLTGLDGEGWSTEARSLAMNRLQAPRIVHNLPQICAASTGYAQFSRQFRFFFTPGA